MLILGSEHLEAVYRHGEEAFPNECCGLLVGMADGPDRVVHRVVRARNLNTDRARDRYDLDPADRLRAEEAAQADGLAVVGFYHSHPDHDSYFSRTDLERSEEYQMGEPWLPAAYSYLVASIRTGRGVEAKSFIVRDGTAEEEPVQIR